MKKFLWIVVLGLLFSGNAYAEKNFDGFVNAFTESRKLKLTIDFENTAKQFGYKNFEEFIDEYKTKYDLDDLTVGEAKEFLIGADRSVKVEETEINLKKLHSLIINNKYLKKDAYFKKKRYDNAKVLAVYLDYEKEMSKITQNPDIDKISRFAWAWLWHTDKGRNLYKSQKQDALDLCEKNRLKRGIPDGGLCILVESRYRDEFEILIKKQFTENTNHKKNSSSVVKQFNQLIELYKSGALTKEEFNQAKQSLLIKHQ